MSNPDDIVGTLVVGVALAALVMLIVAFAAHFTAAMSRDPASVPVVHDRWVVVEGPEVARQRLVAVVVPQPRRPSHPQELSRDEAHLPREGLPEGLRVGSARVPSVRADCGRN